MHQFALDDCRTIAADVAAVGRAALPGARRPVFVVIAADHGHALRQTARFTRRTASWRADGARRRYWPGAAGASP